MGKVRGCFIAVVIIFFFGLITALCIYIPIFNPSSKGGQENNFPLRILGSKNLLFLGIDEREGSSDFKGRADTIVIFHISSWGKKDSLISIPRDTRVYLEGYGWNKINAAYVYGGEEMIKQEIYELTGIEVERYMVVNFDSFKEIIDILGGIEIVISEPLHDPLSGADFDPGTYYMNGEEALSFARCRATPRADLDRINNQQYLLNELLKQKVNLSIIPRIPSMISVINEKTKSDFTIWDYLSVGFVLLWSSKDINLVTIPTKQANIDGISYLVADEKEVKQFLKDYLN